ncbi:MAG: PAS domain-containing protein [Myxococcales bacterium]|nr:PAS domain-containing protein [Myxococcales bacterium]
MTRSTLANSAVQGNGVSGEESDRREVQVDALDDVARCRRLAAILDTSSQAMLAWDVNGGVVEANHAACALTRLSRDELLGTSIHELFPELPRLPHGEAPLPVRLELVLPRQRVERRLPVSVVVQTISGVPPLVAHALIRDDSRFVAAEQEVASHLTRIRLLEKELRTLLDNAPLIIFRLDPDTGQLSYLNRHAERLLRVPLDEALRTRDFIRRAHTDPGSSQAFDLAFAQARGGGRPAPYEARLRWFRSPADEPVEIAVRSTVYPLLSDTGEVVAIEGILVDISAEHEARTRLVQADRLFTLGMIAAGVAHEINNPAAFLTLGLTQLDRLIADPAISGSAGARDASRLIEELRASVDRISVIARDLRYFANPARQEPAQRTFVDVTHALESALTLTRAQIMEHARIVLDLRPVPPVLMNDGRLGQVLVNLLVNAAQAVARQTHRERVITAATRSSESYVEIAIADTGAGITPELVDRIWLPFFTTKGDAGTGLGLSISREIVESSGGTISVESPIHVSREESYGARFIVRLPLDAAKLTAPPSRSGRAPSSSDPPSALQRTASTSERPGERAADERGDEADITEADTTETIAEEHPPSSSERPSDAPRAHPRRRVLIVDDERPLARTLAAELGRRHDVSVAYDGAQALELLTGHSFDVILCDLHMPGMSGESLYARVCARNDPGAPAFVFMTGAAFGSESEAFLATAGRPLLEKPFPMARALEAIERASRERADRGPDHAAPSSPAASS